MSSNEDVAAEINKMDLNEERKRKKEEVISELYNTHGVIDFSKINDYDNQKKVEILMMDVAMFGIECKINDLDDKIFVMQYLQMIDARKPKEQRDDKISVECQKLIEEMFSLEKKLREIEVKKDEAIDYFSKYKSDRVIEFEKLLAEERIKHNNGLSLKERVRSQIREYKLNKKGKETRENLLMEKPTIYSPFNDPDDKYGWKKYCNTENKLTYQQYKLRYYLLEKNEKLDPLRLMKESPPVTWKFSDFFLLFNDEEDIESRSDDGGTDSLSPLQEKKNKTLGTPMEVTDDKKDMSSESKESSGSSNSHLVVPSADVIKKMYGLQIKKALLEFCDRYLVNPITDEDLLAGISYVREN